MPRSKKEEDSYYDGSKLTRAPTIVISGKRQQQSNDQDHRKRPRSTYTSPAVLWKSFNESMNHHLILKIIPCVDDIASFGKIKTKLLNAKVLPRSVMTDAEKHAKCAPGEIKDYLEKSLPKRNVTLWVDFVGANFDHAVKYLLDNPALAKTYMDQNPFSKITADDDAHIQDGYRTYPSSISNIIRKDLPAEAKCIIKQRLDDSTIKISNYISQFAPVVCMMMTELRNCVFDVDHSTGKLKLTRSSGFNIASILSIDFTCQYDRSIQFIASAVSEDFLDSSVFTQDFNLLFWNKRF